MAVVFRIYDYVPTNIVQLLVRVLMGWIFFRSSLGNIKGFGLNEMVYPLFDSEYNLPLIAPDIAAYLAIAAELTLLLLLWVVLFAGFVATGFLIMTIENQTFVYPRAYELHGL